MMKKPLLAISLLALGFLAWKGGGELKETSVPEPVRAALKAKYPNAKNVEWEKEGANYEAELNTKPETSVLIDPQGQILEVETEIATSELPEAAHAYLKQKAPGQKVKAAGRIEVQPTAEQTAKTKYEAEVGNKDYIFDKTGQFLEIEGEKGLEDKD